MVPLATSLVGLLPVMYRVVAMPTLRMGRVLPVLYRVLSAVGYASGGDGLVTVTLVVSLVRVLLRGDVTSDGAVCDVYWCCRCCNGWWCCWCLRW